MVRVRVKTARGEAEVEADPEHLREAIDLIPELISRLPVDSPALAEAPRGVEEKLSSAAERQSGAAQFPTVAIEKSDSLADIIGKCFADPWGRESRKLSDVREVLQSYGLNYPKQSVAVALLRLAKTARIRRFKAEDGEYVYTTSAVTVSSP